MTETAQTLVDGRPSRLVSVDDRGLAYGDGVFETVRIAQGEPVLLQQHLARMIRGCQRLSIPVTGLTDLVCGDIDRLELPRDAVLKIMVTRGAGRRGYSPPPDPRPTRIVSVSHYAPGSPAGLTVQVCRTRLARNAGLAGIKHLNRLEQVLAAAELDAGCDEGLMLDTDGRIVEGTRSNVFLVTSGRLVTPGLEYAGVEGVMRALIMALTDVVVRDVELDEALSADELFMANSVFGIRAVTTLKQGDAARGLAPGVTTHEVRGLVRERLGVDL